ncbi:pyridoxine/pyridoxamine 5'-phosphate oxidase [Aethina tumida]|uniref:pyridoxine/pyridoxamine 5'-phosphate oxidase n=1 Tax=Aethina tumida TaxID=116153 RepID=UPI0021476836|nr:pyridoxine/pyridoxamine 5'-phosphate oxidase [Aethina tumida]XP_049823387.1 pyridoxine/pyridoxamine 5'-phosphate oxidase [Aethina tumida]
MNIGGMRTEYNHRENLFLEKDIEVKDPYVLFEKWFSLVKNDPRTVEPNAMCLATANKDGCPSARFVLLKGYNRDGFRFFTHYTSRKGQEMAENPNVALTFYWEHFSRSVRIEGIAEKLPFSEADKYFSSRPYQSQIGALVSDQSKPIESRDVMSDKEKVLKEKYKEGEVPRPQFWGGYNVRPHTIEFWQGQTDRIHDRIRFQLKEKNIDDKFVNEGENGWVYQRLGP